MAHNSADIHLFFLIPQNIFPLGLGSVHQMYHPQLIFTDDTSLY